MDVYEYSNSGVCISTILSDNTIFLIIPPETITGAEKWGGGGGGGVGLGLGLGWA